VDPKELRQELDKVYQLISYEFGSPVNSLKTMADLVAMDAAATGNVLVAESARYLQDQVEQLQQRLRNLIFWADLQVKNYTFKPGPTPLDPCLAQPLAALAQAAANKGIVLLPAPVTDWQVVADPAMLGLVLHNLVANAVKFSRKGDTVELLATRLPNGRAHVSVRDTGVGMGPAKLAAVFNPARRNTGRGTANEAGLGLGLAVAKAIMDLHGGPLALVSEQGKGTTATLELPLVLEG
jgi:signal transduction histidine kinase